MASLRWTAKAAIVALMVGDDNSVLEVDCQSRYRGVYGG